MGLSELLNQESESIPSALPTARQNVSRISTGVVLALLSLVQSADAANTVPRDAVQKDDVDLIEVNHFYDCEGRLVFNQIIYYDWSHDDARYQIRDWRLLKDHDQIPTRDWRNGGYRSEWVDFKQRNGLRSISAVSVRETWTLHDPELDERAILAQEKRKELTRIPAVQPKPTCVPYKKSGITPVQKNP